MPEHAAAASLPIEGDHSAAREARRFLLVHLPQDPAEEDVDRLLLCTSEVVSNAVEHGRPPRRLDLTVTGREVRVEVHDGDPRQPTPQVVSPLSLRGRGLQIVETAADSWGVTTEDRGKVVWFEITVGEDGSPNGRR